MPVVPAPVAPKLSASVRKVPSVPVLSVLSAEVPVPSVPVPSAEMPVAESPSASAAKVPAVLVPSAPEASASASAPVPSVPALPSAASSAAFSFSVKTLLAVVFSDLLPAKRTMPPIIKTTSKTPAPSTGAKRRSMALCLAFFAFFALASSINFLRRARMAASSSLKFS